MKTRREILHPLVVILLFLFFSFLYSLAVPIWEAPDEPAHYIRVRRLAEPGFSPPDYPGLVRTVWSERYLYSSYQRSQPPLYYLGAAAVLKGLNLFLPPPSGRLIFPPLRPDWEKTGNLFVHTAGFRDRLAGAAAVYGLRFFSVLLGALTVFLIYRIGREVYPDEPAVALGAAGFAACLPQFNFVSGVIGNDPAAALLGAGTLLYLVRRVGPGRPAGYLYYLGLGVLLALGLLTKFNLIFLLPTALIFIFQECFNPGKNQPSPLPLPRQARDKLPPSPRGRGLRSPGLALALTAAPLVLAGAAAAVLFPGEFAWKSRVLFSRLFRVTPELLTRVQVRHMIWTVYRSFFALFGWMSVPVSTWLYLAWGLLSAVALLGWIKSAPGHPQGNRGRGAGLLAAAAAILLLGVIKNNLLVPQSQGRFLFPALGAIAVLFSAGFCRFISDRYRVRAIWTLLVVLAALNFFAFLELLGKLS